jgi:hypothetical protein
MTGRFGSFVLVSCITLCACGTTSEVVPTGKSTYLLTSTARGGLDPGAQVIAATKKANEYCDGMHLHMVVRKLDTAGVPMWTPERATLAFACVSDEDPEYQRK